jgi:hypothetical protein
MKRFAQPRALVNRYPDRFLLGEIAECADSIDVT